MSEHWSAYAYALNLLSWVPSELSLRMHARFCGSGSQGERGQEVSTSIQYLYCSVWGGLVVIIVWLRTLVSL